MLTATAPFYKDSTARLMVQMVNEADTVPAYMDACQVVRHRIETGRDVDISVMHALAVKGHVLALSTHNPLVSGAFLGVHRAEPPGTMEDNAQVE